MERKKKSLLLFVLGWISTQAIAAEPALEGGLLAGYSRGFSLSGQLTVLRAGSWRFPLPLRLGLSFDFIDPGLAEDARQVFINDNRGGTVEKSGHVARFSLDLLIPLRRGDERGPRIFAGLRHGRYHGRFRFKGDNEDFVVICRPWGLGTGLESRVSLDRRWNLLLNAGGDFFFPARFYGHDTWYNPDNRDDNPRKAYTHADADAVIHQPKLVFFVKTGLELRLGR